MPAVTPTQTVADLMSTIPSVAACCGQTGQEVPYTTLHALRTAVANAADEEECIHRLLARCRTIIRQHLIRCQVQADADAVLGGRLHIRSEEDLLAARELLAAVEARLGLDDD
jgi:hypothetical protein